MEDKQPKQLTSNQEKDRKKHLWLAAGLIGGGIFCLFVLGIWILPILVSPFVVLTSIGNIVAFTLAIGGVTMLGRGIVRLAQALDKDSDFSRESKKESKTARTGSRLRSLGESIVDIGLTALALSVAASLIFDSLLLESALIFTGAAIFPILGCIFVGVVIVGAGYFSYRDKNGASEKTLSNHDDKTILIEDETFSGRRQERPKVQQPQYESEVFAKLPQGPTSSQEGTVTSTKTYSS